ARTIYSRRYQCAAIGACTSGVGVRPLMNVNVPLIDAIRPIQLDLNSLIGPIRRQSINRNGEGLAAYVFDAGRLSIGIAARICWSALIPRCARAGGGRTY